MNNKINLSQLAEMLAQVGGMSKTASEQFVKTFFDIISQGVLSEGLVKVKGLGTFKLLQMEDRESINVNTGERFTIEGHQKISFTPDAELKERINKPFSAFETVVISEEQAEQLGDDIETSYSEDPTADDVEPKVEPQVKDVTQKRITRVFLKFIVWILSIILLLGIAGYLFWPVIGSQVMDILNLKRFEKANVTVTARPKPSVTVKDSESEKRDAEEPAKPVEEAVQQTEATVLPVAPASEPEVKPEPAVKENVRPAKENVQFVALTKEDQAKSLASFTEADTVNYKVTGLLAVHTVQEGETLTKLALKYYGTKKLWPYLAQYNDMKSINNMNTGCEIKIPKLAAK